MSKENKSDCSVVFSMLFFPITFVWFEAVVRLCAYRTFPKGSANALVFAFALGFLADIFTMFFHKTVNALITYVFLGILTVYFNVQMIYFTVFQRFLAFRVATGVGTDVLEFKQQIINTIAMRWYAILLLCVPIVVRIVAAKLGKGFSPKKLPVFLAVFGAGALSFCVFLGMLQPGKNEEYSAKKLMFDEWEDSIGVQKLGLFVATGKDLKEIIFPSGKNGEDLDILSQNKKKTTPSPVPTPVPTKQPDNPSGNDPGVTPAPTATPTPLPKYHEQYDFAALAEAESKDSIKKLHQYLDSCEPDRENEYTGKFKGYNYIMITAEGFSPWAVDKDLTPTLYKMINSGFVFDNFYCPLWHTSTSDGEFIGCTGLVPDGAHSMRRSASDDMRFAFGNALKALGYKTMAFHNNSYTYYDRNKSHPNLGYEFRAIGNGLKLPSDCWPRSDYEMMQASVPMYIGEEPFHAYYMTVSGHMQYTFKDNMMCYRNKAVVADLPYSDNARAYIACNYELEKAMTWLLEELEKAGVADHTVICMYPDHYPYGLDKEYIDELAGEPVEENFELYRSCLILYCPGMKETVHVTKYCSTLDVAPTMYNLLGLEYDSRIFSGNDIFSDREGLVILQNKSFITDRIKYNSLNNKITLLTGQPVSQEYVDDKILEVKQKFAFTKGVLDYNYYSKLPKIQ